MDDKCCQIALKIFPFLSVSRFNTQYPPPHFSPADHLSCRDSVMAPHFSKTRVPFSYKQVRTTWLTEKGKRVMQMMHKFDNWMRPPSKLRRKSDFKSHAESCAPCFHLFFHNPKYMACMPRPGIVTNDCCYFTPFMYICSSENTWNQIGTVPIALSHANCIRALQNLVFLSNQENVNKTKVCKWLDLPKYASLMWKDYANFPEFHQESWNGVRAENWKSIKTKINDLSLETEHCHFTIP